MSCILINQLSLRGTLKLGYQSNLSARCYTGKGAFDKLPKQPHCMGTEQLLVSQTDLASMLSFGLS